MFTSSDNNATVTLGADGVVKKCLGTRFEDFWLKVYWVDIRKEASNFQVDSERTCQPTDMPPKLSPDFGLGRQGEKAPTREEVSARHRFLCAAEAARRLDERDLQVWRGSGMSGM